LIRRNLVQTCRRLGRAESSMLTWWDPALKATIRFLNLNLAPGAGAPPPARG
jgi:hypothetical protein